MTATTTRGRATFKYAPTRRVHDAKIGPVAHALAANAYARTPSAAHVRVHRCRDEITRIAAAYIGVGKDGELDRLLAPLDEIRTAGSFIQLDDAAKLSIDRADAEENTARLRCELCASPENVRAAIAAALREVRAKLEYVRGLRCAHPEIVR